MSVTENLTREEARQRAEIVARAAYDVELDLTRGPDGFGMRTRVDCELAAEAETFIDCTARRVVEVTVDGQPLGPEAVEPTRIRLPRLAAGAHEIVVVAEMAYQHDGRGLHRFVDPADDRVYLHSQFEPFDAHLVYACFDQPDIRAPFALTVDAPEEWVVISNRRPTSQPPQGEAGRWAFPATQPVPPYITAVVAGSYTAAHDEHRGIELSWHVRRSLADHLDADELFAITKQGLDFFTRAFDMAYPFEDAYDQLLVPEFSMGAMENPGCVTFNETYVFRSKVTDAVRERRAETILHEMAHMWFGDLVTMQWWDDLWLNESFATFMAVLSQTEATRWTGAWTTFLDAEKAWAKHQDQLPSTHPVADEMDDVESVHQNFDGITYAKGASVLRQLVAWVGQEQFLAGCRDYFAKHAWSNTRLQDFLDALEAASGRELSAWRDEWLLTTGVNRLAAEAEVDADGRYQHVTITQDSPTPGWATLPGVDPGQQPLRRHRLAVGVYDDTDEGLVRRERVELDVTGARTDVADLVGRPAGDVLLVNDGDLTYAKVSLDGTTLERLTGRLHRLVDPLARALVWSSLWDMVRDGELAARRYVDLVVDSVPHEDEVGVQQRLLQRAEAAAERFADPGVRDRLLARLAVAARTQLEQAEPGSDQQLAWARHWAATARAEPSELADVSALLEGRLTIEGLAVDRELRWHLVTCLAAADAIDEERIDAELADDPTDLGERQAATARAARPRPEAKAAAWRRLVDDASLSHTMARQIWRGHNRIDQPEVLADHVDAYFDALGPVWEQRALDWAIEFSAGTFPHHAASPALVDRVDRVLADPATSGPLRRVLLEQRDMVLRTLEGRRVDAQQEG